MLDHIYVGLYNFFSFIVATLKDDSIRNVIKKIGKFAYLISFKHRKIIYNNLDLSFGSTLTKEERKEIAIHSFINLFDTLFGIIRRERMDKVQILKQISFEGENIVENYIGMGKPMIFITGHYGNWELLPQALTIKFNIKLVAVGRKLDSDPMDEILKRSREKFNIEMVYKKGAIRGCVKALSRGKSVGILVDQSIRLKQSVHVTFFGKPATHTPLASILSRKFGLDLIPVFISTEDYKNYRIKIYDPIKTIKTDNQDNDLKKLTQAQADIMEKVIRKNPKQWFWMHRRWKRFTTNKPQTPSA